MGHKYESWPKGQDQIKLLKLSFSYGEEKSMDISPSALKRRSWGGIGMWLGFPFRCAPSENFMCKSHWEETTRQPQNLLDELSSLGMPWIPQEELKRVAGERDVSVFLPNLLLLWLDLGKSNNKATTKEQTLIDRWAFCFGAMHCSEV